MYCCGMQMKYIFRNITDELDFCLDFAHHSFISSFYCNLATLLGNFFYQAKSLNIDEINKIYA